MNAKEINRSFHSLQWLLDEALIEAVKWISSKGTPQEPDYVMALTTKFVPQLYHILVAAFPAYSFSVSSVYCHQKPLADIGLGKKPEIGDILFVYGERGPHGDIRWNSLLLQAKISLRSTLRVHSGEMHQLALYKSWPAFTYYRAGALNGQRRDIMPKAVNDGAQYLLIDSDPYTNGLRGGGFPMGCAVPDDVLHLNNDLAVELIDLLKFKSGRTFDDPTYVSGDDWSRMIGDLLQIAASKFSRRSNVGMASFPRRTDCLHFCEANMNGEPFFDRLWEEVLDRANMPGDDTGVSVVLVESYAKYPDEPYMESIG